MTEAATNHSSRNSAWRGWLVAAALILVAAAGAETAGGASLLHRASLLDEPRPFTELSFAHPDHLPDVVGHGNGVSFQRLTVRVANNQRNDQRYTWTVEAKYGATIRRLAHGAVGVRRNSTSSIDTTIGVQCTAHPVSIRVSLAKPAQSISYWTTCAKNGAR